MFSKKGFNSKIYLNNTSELLLVLIQNYLSLFLFVSAVFLSLKALWLFTKFCKFKMIKIYAILLQNQICFVSKMEKEKLILQKKGK
jgi:hypothetical protein